MSTSARSPRKRALAEYSGDEPASRRLKPSPLESIYQAHVQSELENLKAALEHERSLRALDQRRFQQSQSRLERQMEFAVEEAQEAKALLEDLRTESDAHIAQLREARAEAVRQLRECQEELAQVELEDTADRYDARLAEEKQAVLQEQLQAKSEEISALQERLSEVTQEQLSSLSEKTKTPETPDYGEGGISPAPKEVLRELNKVRVQLAESERKYRQLKRKADEWQHKANLYVQEKEANRSATVRVHQVEQELRELRKEHEAVRASNQSWNEFGKELGTLVLKDSSIRNGPPEIATVLRHLEKAKLHTQKLVDDKASLQKSLDTCNERIIALESLRRDDAVIISMYGVERNDLQSKLESANRQIQSLKAQERIWRREADGLRSLLKTFDELPETKASDTSAATAQSLQVSLNAAQEEIRVLEQDRHRLTKEVSSLRQEQEGQQTEHARVVEKFGKLREALAAETLKVEESESRACKAEALAGKGSFNTDETRVLHLQRNPLTEAIRERYESEIRSLQRQLEEATGQKPARGATAPGSEVDPQKLHQRLKQSFKEQIALFREGVFLMTGYKVDMMPGEKNPRFRARSVYAEQEQDEFMFVCRKNGEEIVSLDLVETPLTKLLSTTDSYQYVTKFNSLPGFMASVQLSLFEKQTFMGL